MVYTLKPAEPDQNNPLTTAFDAIPLAIFVIDSSLRIRWINNRGEALFGCQGENLVGQSIASNQDNRWTWGNSLDLVERIQALLCGGDSIRGEEQDIVLLVDKKETKHRLRITASPIEFAKEQMILIILEDMTLLNTLQEKITEAENLSVTIQMARAAAHDLNQPLSVLFGNLDLLGQHLHVNQPEMKRIDRILESADRVSQGVRRLQMIIHSPKKAEILKIAEDHGKPSLVF